MNIQNHNNKIIINPTCIEDVEAVLYLTELKEYNNIVVDLIDFHHVEEKKMFSSCKSMIIGTLIELMNKGKNVIVMFLDGGSFRVAGGVLNYLATL